MTPMRFREAVISDHEQLSVMLQSHEDYRRAMDLEPGFLRRLLSHSRYGQFVIAERDGQIVAALHAKNNAFLSHPAAVARKNIPWRVRLITTAKVIAGTPEAVVALRKLVKMSKARLPATQRKDGAHRLR